MPTRILYDENGAPVPVDFPDEDTGQGSGEQRTNAEWAALRREKKGREDAEKALADFKRLDLFRQVGLDPNDKRHTYFVKAYDGKDDADSIQKAAIEAGLLVWVDDVAPAAPAQQQGQQPAGAPAAQGQVPPPQMTDEALRQASLASAQIISAAAMGGSPVPQTGVSALDDAYAKGGIPAMTSALRQMGVPIVDSADGVQ